MARSNRLSEAGSSDKLSFGVGHGSEYTPENESDHEQNAKENQHLLLIFTKRPEWTGHSFDFLFRFFDSNRYTCGGNQFLGGTRVMPSVRPSIAKIIQRF